MLGKIVGNYRIESKLGEGGMGAVYKGVDTMLDREVAIKALRPELASQDAVVERFRSEAVTLAKLHHPNIATLYSLFRDTDELYMVLEYVRGETLDSILQRRGALPASDVIPVFCQILDGIDHAHKFGIIHRDIKPANMMLTEDGKLKVLDFGIARLLGSNRMTRAGNIIGTLEYMAPEQVRGQETDSRSDIYALGMMLYEILTGHLPFDSENEFELMRRQLEELPIKPRILNPAIPSEVETAIMRAIQKKPAHRFQTAGEFREFLLNAGFAAHGEIRRITEDEKIREVFNPPSEAALVSGQSMKETRFETPTISNTETSTNEFESSPKKSFLDNLNWMHFTGAGLIVLVIFGLLGLVLFMTVGESPQPAKPDEIKLSENTPKTTTFEEESPLPAPTGPVMDYAGVLDANTKGIIERRLTEFRDRTNPKVEIAVAIVKTTGQRPIFDYSLAVARDWKIGSKENNSSSALLFIAIDDRKYFTQVSRGLRDILTDDSVKQLQQQYLVPALKESNYGKGVLDVIEAYIRIIESTQNKR